MGKRGHDDAAQGATEGIAVGDSGPETKRIKVQSGSTEAVVDLDGLLRMADAFTEAKKALKNLRKQQAEAKSPVKLEELAPELRDQLLELSRAIAPPVATSDLSHKSEIQDQLAALTKFTSKDVERERLPLPAVLDPALEKIALTHRGMALHKQDHLSYERMEWMGDAYLETIASCFIHRTFPRTPSGQCAQFREIIVRNKILAQYTEHYGLDKRAVLPPEFSKGGRPGGNVATAKEHLKVFGDLFEAWIGAVIESDPVSGITRAAEFLKPLWARALAGHIRDEERRAPKTADPTASNANTSLPPKEELLHKIGVKGVKIEYKDIATKRPLMHEDLNIRVFCVGCYLTGWGETEKELGRGTAKSKREAGQKAAQVALANKKLMKELGGKKQALLESQAQQAAMILATAPTETTAAPVSAVVEDEEVSDSDL